MLCEICVETFSFLVCQQKRLIRVKRQIEQITAALCSNSELWSLLDDSHTTFHLVSYQTCPSEVNISILNLPWPYAIRDFGFLYLFAKILKSFILFVSCYKVKNVCENPLRPISTRFCMLQISMHWLLIIQVLTLLLWIQCITLLSHGIIKPFGQDLSCII